MNSTGFEVLLAAMNFRIITALMVWLGTLGLSVQAQQNSITNLWRLRLPDYGSESSPALATDGTIYLGTFYGWLLAVTPDGKVKWKFKSDSEITSSPAVALDGTIYFGSRDRKCYALKPAGKLKWAFTTEGWVDSSPAIETDGTIYFGSWDHNLYALNPNGSLKWKFATSNVVDSSPAIGADGTIFFGSHDKNLYALKPDGTLKWKFTTGGEIISSPAIGTDGTIYFTSTDGSFYALAANGTQRWRTHTGDFSSSSPVIDMAGNLYVAVTNSQVSLTPEGNTRWHFGIGTSVNHSAAVTAREEVFLSKPWRGSGVVDAEPKTLWDFVSDGNLNCSPNISPAGQIYFTDGPDLYALQPPTNAVPPARSSWPMWRADAQHTGRVQK